MPRRSASLVWLRVIAIVNVETDERGDKLVGSVCIASIGAVVIIIVDG